MLLSEGFHLGYYKGRTVGKWTVRHRSPGRAGGYSKSTLGEADHNAGANDSTVLNYRQAQDEARKWLATLEGRHGVKAGFTVANALDEYSLYREGLSEHDEPD